MATVTVWFLVILNPVTGTVDWSRSTNVEGTAPLTEAKCLSEAKDLTKIIASYGRLERERAVCVPKLIGVKL